MATRDLATYYGTAVVSPQRHGNLWLTPMPDSSLWAGISTWIRLRIIKPSSRYLSRLIFPKASGSTVGDLVAGT